MGLSCLRLVTPCSNYFCYSETNIFYWWVSNAFACSDAWKEQIFTGIPQTKRATDYISIKFRDISVVPPLLPCLLLFSAPIHPFRLPQHELLLHMFVHLIYPGSLLIVHIDPGPDGLLGTDIQGARGD